MSSKYIFLLIGQFQVACEVSLTALAAFTAVDQKFQKQKGMNNKNEARRTSPFIRRARSRGVRGGRLTNQGICSGSP